MAITRPTVLERLDALEQRHPATWRTVHKRISELRDGMAWVTRRQRARLDDLAQRVQGLESGAVSIRARLDSLRDDSRGAFKSAYNELAVVRLEGKSCRGLAEATSSALTSHLGDTHASPVPEAYVGALGSLVADVRELEERIAMVADPMHQELAECEAADARLANAQQLDPGHRLPGRLRSWWRRVRGLDQVGS